MKMTAKQWAKCSYVPKMIFKLDIFTAPYDKGYHPGSEFKITDQLNINVLIAIPKVAANAPNPAYNVEHFTHDNENDYYSCPQGERMTSTGKWHQAKTYGKK